MSRKRNRDQRAESREQRVDNGEQRAKSRKQKAELLLVVLSGVGPGIGSRALMRAAECRNAFHRR